MKDKKYFSIEEVAALTGSPAHKLRYLEKIHPDFEVLRIRGRRYYTKENIILIRENYGLTNKILSPTSKMLENNILFQIDNLIAKFSNLLKNS